MIISVSKTITAAFLLGALIGCSSSSSSPAETSNSINPNENNSEAPSESESVSSNEPGEVTSGPFWTVDGVAFQGDVDVSQQFSDNGQVSTSIRTTDFNFGSNVNVESLLSIQSTELGAGNYTLVGSAQEFVDAQQNSPGSPVAYILVVVDSNQGGNASYNSATGTVSATIVGDDVYHYSTSEPVTFTLEIAPGNELSVAPPQVQVTLNDVFGIRLF